ncbi:hypothetical protein UR09_04095 [Candidatus Nitromaritima sp. SCGC AAA799-A02]|nr:hypothetical protein UR09_04095 [Candidatus Nitromaritima sp. SCGC AAA799-A02]KMP12439.1 hypothetical protein UZ36_00825 [Candidatus Nitromaritima sp. SCGC AAA799-C22]
MAERMNIFYDKEGDVLDMSLGEPREAVSEKISEDFFVRKNPDSDEIVGFMILNFEKRFQKLGQKETIPLNAEVNIVT